MTVFYCKWDDDQGLASIVIDTTDKADARKCATEIAEGKAPRHVVEMPPRVLIAEVVLDSELNADTDDLVSALDDDDDEIEGAYVLSPLAAFEHAIDLLEEGEIEEFVTMTGNARLERVPDLGDGGCTSVATDEGNAEVRCMLVDGHAGAHMAGDLEWGSDG